MVQLSSDPEPVSDATDDATRTFRRGSAPPEGGTPDDTKERARFLGSLIEEALPPSEQIKMRLGDIMKPASTRIAVTDQHADALLCDANDWEDPVVEAKPASTRSERPKPSWDRPIPTAPTTPTPLTFSAPSWPPPPTEWTPESERRVPSVFARRDASVDDIDVLIESAPDPVVPASLARSAQPYPPSPGAIPIDPVAARRRSPYLVAALATFGFVFLGGVSALVTSTYLSRADRSRDEAPVVVAPPHAIAAKVVPEIPPRAAEPAAAPAKPARPSDAIAVEDLRLLPPEGAGTLAIGTHYDGHRVLVDGASVGRAPGFFKVRCGVRKVRVLATERSIDVPCGGEATFTPPSTH